MESKSLFLKEMNMERIRVLQKHKTDSFEGVKSSILINISRIKSRSLFNIITSLR